jgi:hypothetical protein
MGDRTSLEKFHTVFEGYELEAPSTELQETKSQLRQMYFDMTTIRYVALFFAQLSRTEEFVLN